MRSERVLPTLVGIASTVLVIGCAADVQSNATSEEDEALIANAMSAAPEPIAHEATIVVPDDMGELRVLREGTSEWTCLPDDPATPGNMPMCTDRAGVAWIQAMMRGEEPPADGPVSVAYMLQGAAFPSYDDPDVMEPPDGGEWYFTGPILMIQNVRGRLNGYATEERDVDAPFVMYEGTHYEHLMVPLGSASP